MSTRTYIGATAAQIVRAMEVESNDYPFKGSGLRQFLLWSLARLDARSPLLELGMSELLDDETLALSYFCLLESYGLAELWIVPGSPESVH